MTEIEVEEKTEFKFSELSDTAKARALDNERYTDHYLDYKWWDGIYEDAVSMALVLGIKIDTTAHSRPNGKSYESIDIFFSGFYSQGDGASFAGSYAFKPDAVEKIVDEAPQDEELLRIATALGVLSITQRLLGGDSIECSITTNGRYSGSGTMQISHDGLDDIEEDLLQLMRDFADWIYKRLEDEHDYLMSDDVVAEGLQDEVFDEFGFVI